MARDGYRIFDAEMTEEMNNGTEKRRVGTKEKVISLGFTWATQRHWRKPSA